MGEGNHRGDGEEMAREGGPYIVKELGKKGTGGKGTREEGNLGRRNQGRR